MLRVLKFGVKLQLQRNRFGAAYKVPTCQHVNMSTINMLTLIMSMCHHKIKSSCQHANVPTCQHSSSQHVDISSDKVPTRGQGLLHQPRWGRINLAHIWYWNYWWRNYCFQSPLVVWQPLKEAAQSCLMRASTAASKSTKVGRSDNEVQSSASEPRRTSASLLQLPWQWM